MPLEGALHVDIIDIAQDGQLVVLLELLQPRDGVRERAVGPGGIAEGLSDGVGQSGDAELVSQPRRRRYQDLIVQQVRLLLLDVHDGQVELLHGRDGRVGVVRVRRRQLRRQGPEGPEEARLPVYERAVAVEAICLGQCCVFAWYVSGEVIP